MLKFHLMLATLVGMGCAPAEDGDTGSQMDDTDKVVLEACEGEGEPTVALGGGGRVSFSPFDDGDDLQLSENSSGARGFYIEAMASGLDMREALTLVYRVSVDDGATDDYLSRVGLMCDDLEGWNKSFLEFDDTIDLSKVDGASIAISVVVTNDAGESASSDVTLVGSSSW